MKQTFLAIILFGTLLSSAQSGQKEKYEYYKENKEWDDYFMPSLGYKIFTPKATELGVYHGLVTEFVIYARARGKYPKSSYARSGPARIKSYINLSILKSDNTLSKDIYTTNVGFTASFEGASYRSYFIPYFGLELGGLYQKHFKTFHFTPTLGIQMVSTEKVIWTLYSGYQYTTKRFDEWSGVTLGSTLSILLWK
jgi:hypothetical protein|tara:strand:- start:9696 stop:10283 length:588 start_codon:yes stop_codon:yes gene_type:complete